MRAKGGQHSIFLKKEKKEKEKKKEGEIFVLEYTFLFIIQLVIVLTKAAPAFFTRSLMRISMQIVD